MTRTTAIIAGLLALSVASACGIGDAQRQLRSAVDAKQAEMDQCYTAALARDASTQGRLDAWINVGKEAGRVETVEFAGGDVTDQELQNCLNGVLTGVELPEPPAANLRVSYTFELTPTQ